MKYVETIKIVDGVVHNFDYHYKRALATSGIKLSMPQIPNDKKQGIIKCRIVYDDQEVSQVEFLPYEMPRIQSLKVVNTPHYFYEKKYVDRDLIQSLYAQKDDCDDILIVVDGALTDTSFCNVVFESRDGFFTPAFPLLKGTKRASLINQGTLIVRHITLDDLGQYSYVRLINAMIDMDNESTRFPVSHIYK